MNLLRYIARGFAAAAMIFALSYPVHASPASEARKATIGAEAAIQKTAARKEFECLATAIYFEARGEPVEGQMAVGRVILNRVGHGLYPETICGVVYENKNRRNACQFSFACDGIKDVVSENDVWQEVQVVTTALLACSRLCAEEEAVIEAAGDTEGAALLMTATHYHATYVHPGWASRMEKRGQIGRHIFYYEDMAKTRGIVVADNEDVEEATGAEMSRPPENFGANAEAAEPVAAHGADTKFADASQVGE